VTLYSTSARAIDAAPASSTVTHTIDERFMFLLLRTTWDS
jgi:hypothetical protein